MRVSHCSRCLRVSFQPAIVRLYQEALVNQAVRKVWISVFPQAFEPSFHLVHLCLKLLQAAQVVLVLVPARVLFDEA